MVKLSETQIRDGVAHIRQGKTKNKVRIIIETLLEEILQRIRARKAALSVVSLNLLVTERGQPLTQTNLRRMFDQARRKAVERADTDELRERIKAFQYRDLRAKAGTDRDEQEGREKARELLSHASDRMTDTYIRNRRGKLVHPSKGVNGGQIAEQRPFLRNNSNIQKGLKPL